MGDIGTLEANSWMVVPSTTMTKGESVGEGKKDEN
jgi:hypothetical protein